MKKFKQVILAFLKKHWGLLVVLAAAFLVATPFIHEFAMTGHDSNFHMFRYSGILNAWKDGQLVPQLDPASFGGFGYAPSLFYGPLTGWVVLIWTSFTPSASLFIGVNGMMALAVFGSALAFYALAREVTKKTVPSALAAVAYTVAPYHLLDFFVRRSDGEFFPFMFAPLVFLGLYRLTRPDNKKNAVLPLAIGGAGMLLSHNLSALIWAVAALVFVAINWRSIFVGTAKKQWKKSLPALLFSGFLMLLLSAVYWLPMLEARGAATYNIMNSNFTEANMGGRAEAVATRGIRIGELFFNTGVQGDMFFAFGLVAVLGVLAFYLARNKMPDDIRKFTRQMLWFGLIAGFLSTVGSAFLWEHAPNQVAIVQFPWRLLTITSFAMAFVSGFGLYYFLKDIMEKHQKSIPLQASTILGAILIVAAASSQIAVGVSGGRWRETFNYDLVTGLVEHPSRGWWYGAEYEYLPSNVMGCTDVWGCHIKENIPEWMLDRKAEGIMRYCDDGTLQEAGSATCAGYLEYPLFYYPAYTATAGGESLEVFESNNGLVAVSVAEGQGVGRSQHQLVLQDGTAIEGVTIDEAEGITVEYATSRATKYGLAATVIGAILLIAYSILHYRKNRSR
jgi:hypothetical protein